MEKWIESLTWPLILSLLAMIGTAGSWVLQYRKRDKEVEKLKTEIEDKRTEISAKQMREWEKLYDEVNERLAIANEQVLQLKNRVLELELHIKTQERETDKSLERMNQTISNLKAQNTRLHNNLRRVVKQLLAIDNTVVPDVDEDLLN